MKSTAHTFGGLGADAIGAGRLDADAALTAAQAEPCAASTPTVTDVSPNAGSTAGGDHVTITGTNLTGATSVKFGTTEAADFSVTDDGHIDVTTPAADAGTVDVTVTTAGGTSPVGDGDTYTFNTPPIAAPPTVTDVSPHVGPMSGGTTVTITGTNLSGATVVSFGGKPAKSFTVDQDEHITATAPSSNTASTVDVTVTTDGGTSATSAADHFRYLPKPRVTHVSPGSGTKAGGTRVVITGSGFTNVTVVRFGSKAASSVTVKSSTKIVVRTPKHARATVDVVVVTPGGTSAKVKADHYRYV
jgi:hypothetical protein